MTATRDEGGSQKSNKEKIADQIEQEAGSGAEGKWHLLPLWMWSTVALAVRHSAADRDARLC
jgi:hypothetical protein